MIKVLSNAEFHAKTAGQVPGLSSPADHRRVLPSPNSAAENNVRRSLRVVVQTFVKDSEFESLYESFRQETEARKPNFLSPSSAQDDLVRDSLQVCQEKAEVFESLCERMSLSQFNARERFRATVKEIFSTGMSWQLVVTMISFTAHAAAHCAKLNMEEQSIEIVDEAESYIHENFQSWLDTRIVKGSPLRYLLVPAVQMSLDFAVRYALGHPSA